MSEREELAGMLFTTDNSKAVSPWSEWEHCKQEPRLSEYVYAMADALIQAGYRRPRTITTVEELDAAIIKSFEQGETLVLMDAWRPWIIWEDDYGDAHVSSLRMEDDPERLTLADVPFPVTVIYEPLP